MEVTNMDTNACWSVEETWEDRDGNSDVVDEDDDVDDDGDYDIDDDGDKGENTKFSRVGFVAGERTSRSWAKHCHWHIY